MPNAPYVWVDKDQRPFGWFSDEDGGLYAETVGKHPQGVVVELGVCLGRSLSYVVSSGAMIFAIDFWNWSKTPDIRCRLDLFMANLVRMNGLDNVNVLQLDSVVAARLFDPETVDVILVDSQHSEEHTRREINAWWPKVKRGGAMLFHDYGNADFPGVKAAVDEKFCKPNRLVGNLALVEKN